MFTLKLFGCELLFSLSAAASSLNDIPDHLARNEDPFHRPCNTNNDLDASSFSTPIYTEPRRPQIHYSASSGFMNDSNGLIKSGDTWHLYFEYNPVEPNPEEKHWGHATSKDLYTWTNHLPSISPEAPGQGIFTVSTVLDVNNTSGLFNESTLPQNRFVAIYTLSTLNKTENKIVNETQSIAFSVDGGYEYTKSNGNSVFMTPFLARDPKVFWDDITSKWFMALALCNDYQVGFHASLNLMQWTEVSRFGPLGYRGYQWEGPNLVQVPVIGGPRQGVITWLLIVSVNPGMPLGGGAVTYFFGDWNGTRFIPIDLLARNADFGKEWYAAQVFSNGPEGKATAMAWASNWQYSRQAPTSPFKNTQSLPRELTLVWSPLNPDKWDYLLAQQPYNLESISHQKTTFETNRSSNHTISLEGNGAFEILANFSISKLAVANATNPRGEIKIFDSAKKGFLKIGFRFGVPLLPVTLYVDRRFAGTDFADGNPTFTERFSQVVYPLYKVPGDESSDRYVELQIIVDRTMTEIFAQKGVASALVLTYWDDDKVPASIDVGLGEDSIKLDNLVVKSIPSTWMHCP